MPAGPEDMPQKSRKRRLWLILILGIPAAILCLLFLPFALILGSHLAGAFVGPVNVWNSTTHIASEADIEGHYQLSIKHSTDTENQNVAVSDDSGFTLRRDHDLEVHGLPDFDGFGRPIGCSYNGTGKWNLDENTAGVMLDMHVMTVLPPKSGNIPSCKPAYFGAFALLGHSKPYRLWYYIDDPDEGEGLMYELR